MYDSAVKCKKGKLYKSQVANFWLHGIEESWKLSNQLKSGTYKAGKTHVVHITRPKKRDAVATQFRDRVYQRSLNDSALYPEMTRSFIYDNMACQQGKGTDLARSRIKELLHRAYLKYGSDFYILQCDVKGYYKNNKLWEYSQYPLLKSVSQKAREILREQYGTIPAGENAVRAAELPAKTNKMNRVSKTAATAIEAGVTTDTVAEQIQQKAVEGEYSYLPITDESAKQRADETIRRKGWDDALTDWRVDMRKSAFPGKDMVTMGFQLYNNAVNAGDTKTALHILTDITNTVRNSAQVVQAVRILKQLSPDDRLYAVRRQIDSIQEELNKRYGDKAPQIDMNSSLVENYRNAQGEEAIRAAEEALFRDIAAKLPNTFADKWNSWRYLSILGNIRTHVRNVLGNVGFAPVRSIKDWIAYGMEAGVNAISPDGIARTKGKLFVHSEADRALYSAGLKDYDTAENLIGSANLKSGDALPKLSRCGRRSAAIRPFGGRSARWRSISYRWIRFIT